MATEQDEAVELDKYLGEMAREFTTDELRKMDTVDQAAARVIHGAILAATAESNEASMAVLEEALSQARERMLSGEFDQASVDAGMMVMGVEILREIGQSLRTAMEQGLELSEPTGFVDGVKLCLKAAERVLDAKFPGLVPGWTEG